MKIALIAAIGALASILANRGIAVFNDGLRSIVPECMEGRMSKKELASTAFSMSFGLIMTFGIPISLTSDILLVHSILLGTDIIGSYAPKGKKGIFISGILGVFYSVGILLGVKWIAKALNMFPINFMNNIDKVGTPIIVSFSVLPALVIGYQFGTKKGALSLAFLLLIKQLIDIYITSINSDIVVFVLGMVILIFCAMKEKPEEESVDLTSLFGEKIDKMKKNVFILMAMGALLSVATFYNIIAGDPISLYLANEGKFTEAGLSILVKGIGFIPLITSTTITTGIYGMVGMYFVFAIGLFAKSPILAAILGALAIGMEVLFLDKISKSLDKFPGIRTAADNIRNAMAMLVDILLLVGAMNFANAIAPGIGFFIVVGIYVLNDIAGNPVPRMAIGPVAAIVIGIVINILAFLRLFVPPLL